LFPISELHHTVENPVVETAVFVVIPHEADLVQNHHVRGGSECDFQEAMPIIACKDEDGRLSVVDVVALMELIIGHDASPVLAYEDIMLGVG
jgi:hypothetical protein